ncbi:MAG: HupE/UreJ family protein [bacterium]|nr:HupE/UreJ family protein [bacterium]
MSRHALVAALAGLLLPVVAMPHSFEPALLALREVGGGLFDVVWKSPMPRGADDPIGGLTPVLPAHCRTLADPGAPAEPETESVEVARFFRVDCGAAGLAGAEVAVEGLPGSRVDVLVRVTWADGRVSLGSLRSGAETLVVPGVAGGEPVAALFARYVRLGVEHIAEGIDHLLFVLVLVLLVDRTRALVATVTAFTLAHTLTLALAVLGIVAVPPAPVEAAIALSIVLVAAEVARGTATAPSLARRYPWVIAFAFGLLHGLGFAGALREVGVPADGVALALVGFNLGVELGQLAFVVLLLPLRAALRRAPVVVQRLPAYAVGTLAVMWTLERVAAFWRPPAG